MLSKIVSADGIDIRRLSMRRRILVLATVIILFVMCYPTHAQNSTANDPWSSFQFLIGKWLGAGSGQPGEVVAGSTSFSFGLGQNILIRKNRAEFAPKPGEKWGAVHEDLMIIYRQPGEPPFRAIYFDNEGRVINYHVSCPEKQQSIVFESDPSDKAPRFRFIYEMGPDGLLCSEFLIAPPGGEFKTYTKGKVKRVT
jgi:hypothetical protein